MAEELKTKDYILRAKKNYRDKHDNVNIVLPKGSTNKIREITGESVNAYINRLIKEDMLKSYGIDI